MTAARPRKMPPLDQTKLGHVPEHIAIILDGNGRWAKKRGLPRLFGHQAGTQNLRGIVDACAGYGIKYLTIFAFSTENWKRPPDEVSGLMALLEDRIEHWLLQLHEHGVQLRHLGHLEGVHARLAEKIQNAIELTRNNTRIVLNFAFNYGGRDEIVRAVQHMIEDGLHSWEITPERISEYLYTAGQPDPDLIIRTSGEFRTSNFLVWQSAYSEWYFTPVFWPDFDERELRKALEFFAKRERRFGKVPEQVTPAAG